MGDRSISEPLNRYNAEDDPIMRETDGEFCYQDGTFIYDIDGFIVDQLPTRTEVPF